MTHPDYETLLNYVEASQSVEARASTEAHLNQPCSQCQARTKHIAELLGMLAVPDSTFVPPPAVLRRMLNVPYRQRISERSTTPLSLVFDSLTQRIVGSRAGGAPNAQQLLFSAEGVDVDLHVTSGPNQLTLRGQVLGSPSGQSRSTILVILQSGEENVLTTETDRLGQFVFHSVPAGTYDLHVELEETEIAIPGLRLGA